jgi:hypothetical protein
LCGTPNHTKLQPHPLANFSALGKAWNNLTTNIDTLGIGHLRGHIGSMGNKLKQFVWFLSTGDNPAILFLLLLSQGGKFRVSIHEEKTSKKKKKGVPYKLVT